MLKKTKDAEIKKVEKDGTMTKDKRRDKMKELRKKRMNAIEALLTPEQKQKSDYMKKVINQHSKVGKE
jgi:Spy/CpxP family protein refolding chaperone